MPALPEDSAQEHTPPEDAPGENAPKADAGNGVSYRALLPGDRAFDITLHEHAPQLILQAAGTCDGEDRSPSKDASPQRAPQQAVAYRFDKVGEAHFLLGIGGRSVPVTVTEAGPDEVRVTLHGRTATVRVQDETDLLLERFGIDAGAGTAEAEVRAPMPGLVVRVLVEEGQEVREGDGLLVLEAMKMENELRAPTAGVVTSLHTEEGASADKGEVLMEIEAG